jgi:hypothetical protein
VTLFCKFCKKKGHYEDFCWAKHKLERQQKETVSEKAEKSQPAHNVPATQPINPEKVPEASSKKEEGRSNESSAGNQKDLHIP